MDGVNSTGFTPLSNAAGTQSGSKPSSTSKENQAKSNGSDNEAAALDENTPPLAPESFNALLETQESAQSSPFDSELTPEEEKQVQELKQTDAEVRAHEAAHKTAGGPVAGSVSFQTVTGPDGREYAVAGEVQIDASPVANNPEATIRKMELVIRAALAPAEPSSQDRAVAAQAQQARLQAQQELAQQRAEEQKEANENNALSTLSQSDDLQNTESEVKDSPSEGNQGDSASDSSTEIVSILFGK